MGTAASRSSVRTERKARPSVGRKVPAAIWLLAKATAKSASMPMHSPVDRISGPRITSTPGNFENGNTDSFTAWWGGSTSSTTPSFPSCSPIITFAARFAQPMPVALPTKGTVRLARGFTSMTYTSSAPVSWFFCTAHWQFISPRTPRRSAICRDKRLISSIVSGFSECGGIVQAESPEWMPASSMCSITAATIARGGWASKSGEPADCFPKSATTSTSHSVALKRKRSTRIGWPARSLAPRASIMYRRSCPSSKTVSIARPPSTKLGRTSTG